MFQGKPFSVAAIGPAGGTTTLPFSIDLPAIAVALWNRKLLLCLCGLLGAIAVSAIAAIVPHRYTASATILVDPRDLRVLDKEVTPRMEQADSGITIVESQLAVLSSNNVLKRAIEKLGLESDPEFNGTDTNPIVRALTAITNLVVPPKADSVEVETLQTLKQQVTAIRPERTFVLQLTVSSRDEDKSVRIADAIVAAYLEDQEHFRSSRNEGAAEAIDAGLDGMKKKVNEAEEKIAAYKTAHGLVAANGRLVTEQQLSDTNNQLALARAETSRIKAQLEDIKSSKNKAESIPEVVSSQTLINLKKQLATVSADRARLAAQLMPRHPALIALTEQESQVQSDLDKEIKRILASVTHDYQRAKERENSLSKSVETLQSDMNTSAVAQIELRELERDFEASRQLYEQAVSRSRETREQSRLNTSNVRVISPATAAPNRAFPPREVILLPAGFILGFMAGAALIAARHVLGGGAPARAQPESRRARQTYAPLAPSDNTMNGSSAHKETGATERASTVAKWVDRVVTKRNCGDDTADETVPQAPSEAMRSRQSRITSPAPVTPSRSPRARAVDALKRYGDEQETEVQIAPVAETKSVLPAADIDETLDSEVKIVKSPVSHNDNAGSAQKASIEASSANAKDPVVIDMCRVSELVQTAANYAPGMAIQTLAKSVVTSPHGAFARQIRDLRSALLPATAAVSVATPHSVVFESEAGVALKPALVFAFAKASAEAGMRVLLVDANAQEPALSNYMVPFLDNQQPTATSDIVPTQIANCDFLFLSDTNEPTVSANKTDGNRPYDVIVVDANLGAARDLLGSTGYDVVQLHKVSSSRPEDEVEVLKRQVSNLCGVVLVSDRPAVAAASVTHAAS